METRPELLREAVLFINPQLEIDIVPAGPGTEGHGNVMRRVARGEGRETWRASWSGHLMRFFRLGTKYNLNCPVVQDTQLMQRGKSHKQNHIRKILWNTEAEGRDCSYWAITPSNLVSVHSSSVFPHQLMGSAWLHCFLPLPCWFASYKVGAFGS